MHVLDAVEARCVHRIFSGISTLRASSNLLILNDLFMHGKYRILKLRHLIYCCSSDAHTLLKRHFMAKRFNLHLCELYECFAIAPFLPFSQ